MSSKARLTRYAILEKPIDKDITEMLACIKISILRI